MKYKFRNGKTLIVEYNDEIRIDWEEDKHPRGKNGQFVSKGSTDVSDRDTEYDSGVVGSTIKGDLLTKHTKDGKLTPQREKLHKGIVDVHLAGKIKPQGQPVFTLLGGGSASGKSTFTNDPNNGFTNTNTYVKVDSDAIKEMLPEYQELKETNQYAASYAHEESSALAKRVVSVAEKAGHNVMLDGTGDGSLKGLLKKINEAKANGMRVEGIYCTADVETVLARNKARADKTGRLVPDKAVLRTHKAVSQILPKVAKYMDSCKLYDTNGKPAKLIAVGGNGKDLTPVKGMELEFQKFLDKAKI